ncbi:MAG: sigma 54-interacting transcriptional regulator, partial [Candidatus Diapherotrites archaeon]|nr:sigma 54-interacting transcriptional regulator [Candidatus Diapherotrites archaeon]
MVLKKTKSVSHKGSKKTNSKTSSHKTSSKPSLKLNKLVSSKSVSTFFPKISKRQHKGYVYNVTTETGNLFVEDILVHNSGGLGTPPHLRVEPGMIHRASGGVLFIDEIATLSHKSQQELLTAMQEKKYSITGQSENSSGAMTRTDPIPTDFVLIA